MSMQAIDEALRNTEVRQRQLGLIMNLNRWGVYKAKDGKSLESLDLDELESLNIETLNDVTRELGD